MKKLGIIGGAGPYASALLYRAILDHCNDYEDQLEMLILNYPFTRGLTRQESSQNKGILKRELQSCIDALFSYGVDTLTIACNTLHGYIHALDLRGMGIVQLPQSVLQEAERNNIQKILILATQSTLATRLYDHPTIKQVPVSKQEQIVLDRIIDRLLSGKISERDSKCIEKLALKIYRREPFEGIVLGCTDLPVLHDRYPIALGDLPIFDSIRIPAKTIYQQFRGA